MRSPGETKKLVLEIIQTCSVMRATQKEYFYNRNKGTLDRAKQLEKRLDSLLEKFYSKQQILF